MKIIVLSKTTFNMIQYSNVSNIAFGADTFTVTDTGNTYTYAYADYNVQIVW